MEYKIPIKRFIINNLQKTNDIHINKIKESIINNNEIIEIHNK